MLRLHFLVFINACFKHWLLNFSSAHPHHVRQVVLVMSGSTTLWTVAHQAPLSMGFSRQKYWSGLLYPSPGNLPKPVSFKSPALADGFFTTSTIWETLILITHVQTACHFLSFRFCNLGQINDSQTLECLGITWINIHSEVLLPSFLLLKKNFYFVLEYSPLTMYDSFRWTAEWLSCTYTCMHSPPNTFPSRLSHNIEQSSLSYTLRPCWLSILSTAVCTCPSQTP